MKLADESLCGCTVEQWSLHGYYRSDGGGICRFVASLLRVGAAEHHHSFHGFALAYSLVGPEPLRTRVHTRVDGSFVDWNLARARRTRRSNIDPDYIRTLVSEIERKGSPRPIETRPSPRWTSKPFHLDWEDFHWQQCGAGFELSFSTAESDHDCQLRLAPSRPKRPMELPVPGGVNPPTLTIRPGLRLEGSVDGAAVRGEAWLDHRAGDSCGWIGQDGDGRVLGYDGFSIHLEDGSDWRVLRLRDAERSASIAVRARCWAGGTRKDSGALHLETLRFWDSPSTRIRYPIETRLEFPELDAEFCFLPLEDDQEIEVLGPSRAIWDGAGTVQGMVAGRRVCGHARAAFAGYGYVFDFQRYLDPLQARVDRRIEEFFPRSIEEDRLSGYLGKPNRQHEPGAYGATLSEPVWDLMSRKGKRWRPIFGLLVLEALGTDAEPYEQLLCNLAELPHTGALIIDDIEDSSEIRRGETTIHLKYGIDVAVNAGNTLYFLPSLLIKNHPLLSERQKIQLYEILFRQFVRAHFGQALDIYWSREMGPSSLDAWINDSLGPKILQMYEYKTAAAVAGFAEAAAVIAMASEKQREACARMARAFGVSFQIVDDTLNFSQSLKWGKTTGEDLSEGKLTYAIYRALDRLGAADQHRLREILCSKELRADPDVVREGAELVRQSGALKACRGEAQSLLEEAWCSFSVQLPSSEPKMMLRMLCLKLLDLAYDV